MESKGEVKWVDLVALGEAFKMLQTRYGYGLEHWGQDKQYFRFRVSREAMNTNGFHVGTEYFDGMVRIIPKDFLAITKSAHVSRFAVIPDTLEVENIATPEEEYSEDEDEDGEKECLYFPPDEDFAFQELGHVLDTAIELLPDWEFRKTEDGRRIWSCGTVEIEV